MNILNSFLVLSHKQAHVAKYDIENSQKTWGKWLWPGQVWPLPFLLLSWILVTTKHPGAVTQKHAEWGTCSTDIVSWRSEVEVRVRVTVSPSTREAEAGRSLWVHRPAWLTEWVPAYPGLHKETQSWKNPPKPIERKIEKSWFEKGTEQWKCRQSGGGNNKEGMIKVHETHVWACHNGIHCTEFQIDSFLRSCLVSFRPSE